MEIFLCRILQLGLFICKDYVELGLQLTGRIAPSQLRSVKSETEYLVSSFTVFYILLTRLNNELMMNLYVTLFKPVVST